MRLLKILIGLLFLFQTAIAQTPNGPLKELQSSFQAFDYTKVIALSKELISKNDSLSLQSKTDILRMQGIAYYSIDELLNSEKSFIDLLTIQSNFILDPSANSPKIISFFNGIKLKYLDAQKINIEKFPQDTINIAFLEQEFKDYKDGILRSLLLPGWGHYYVNEPLKGKILNAAALATLIPAIYYSIETHSREKKYLTESDRSKIAARYNSFNEAYNYRNYLISAFTAIWLYTQYDYFFGEHSPVNKNMIITAAYDPFNKINTLHFSVQF